MKPITTHLANGPHYYVRLFIMHYVARRSKGKVEFHESRKLKGFRFTIKRGKTIICEEV